MTAHTSGPDQLALPLTQAGLRYSATKLAAMLRLPTPTPEQAEVIEAPFEPGVVVAGAGSGKTETMAARVVWLVANDLVRPEQVLGLTFTRKAARELAARIRRRLGQLRNRGYVGTGDDPDGLAGDVTVSTYDAYAQRVVAEHALRLGHEPGSRLITPAMVWQFATRVVEAYDGPMDEVTRALVNVISDVIALHGELAGHLVDTDELQRYTEDLHASILARPPGRARLKGATHADTAEHLRRQLARLQLLPLVKAFEAEKRRRGVVDFSDQAALAARLADRFEEVGERERDRYAVVLLDEYQDTSHAQLVMLRGLFGAQGGAHPITAVGDPFQSIYGWRGASAGTLVSVGKHFGGSTLSLTTSFRNGARILRAANLLAAPLRDDGLEVPELSAHSSTGDGEVVVALHNTIDDEAADITDRARQIWKADARKRARGKGRTIAILVRKWAQVDRIAHRLREAELPVEVIGLGGLLTAPPVADVVATLQVLADPTQGNALMRLVTGARWRIGPRDLHLLGAWSRRLAATRMGAEPGSQPRAQPGTNDTDSDAADSASIIDAVDALDSMPPESGVSPEGRRRLATLAGELRGLRRRTHQPLVDLIADVVRTLGLDVEVAARTGDIAVSRADIDAFFDVASDFSEQGDDPSLTSFLAYLEAAEKEERGLEPGQVEVSEDRIQVLTVHGSKGLEWDVVFVPGLVEGVFPSAGEKDKAWLSEPGELPFPLRGDRDALPVLDLSGAADQTDIKEAFERFQLDAGAWARQEERRLAYVAATRARSLLVWSGYWWEENTQPRTPSAFLTSLAEAGRQHPGEFGEVAVWVTEEERSAENPVSAEPPSHAWPYDPMGPERRAEVESGASLVAAAKHALARGESLAEPVAEAAERWDRDVELLLTERARRSAREEIVVELPEHLSVSQLVQLRKDPSGLAESIRRPVPHAPNPLARRGTAFHAWLESRFGMPQLLDVDELPGAADEQAASDEDLERLQEAFLASEWADRTPSEIEVPFEVVVGGIVIRGRADAVFAVRGPDGLPGLEVVDWKTGRPPDDPDDAAARAVQLAAYRLAWAQLSGLPLERVAAAFHYVRHRRTVRPVDLLDREGLEALVTSVPLQTEDT
jgi:DNA helicase-2/ATP-dependent DNA helicase PcrA